MRFVPFHQLDSTPNIIVDGAAGPGTILTLSHWPKSGTAKELKRDTSAEIVFAYLDSPGFHAPAEIVSNNHYDEDGLVGIFAILEPRFAQAHRELLIDVASAGDFGVYQRRDAARIAFAIAAYADPDTSPLPKEIFALPYPEMAGRLYEEILELLPKLLINLEGHKSWWEADNQKLTLSEDLIDKGEIVIEERPSQDLAVLHVPEHLPCGMTECHPFAVNSRTKCTRVLTMQGAHVEFIYRYESWVQLVTRRPQLRVDLTEFGHELNERETSGGEWKFDGVEHILPRLHLVGGSGLNGQYKFAGIVSTATTSGESATSISPAWIEQRLVHHLSTGKPAWDPYD